MGVPSKSAENLMNRSRNYIHREKGVGWEDREERKREREKERKRERESIDIDRCREKTPHMILR